MSLDRILVNLEVNLHNAATGFNKLDALLKKVGSRLATVHRTVADMDVSMKSFKDMLLGVGLSFLFTGMAIKNFFQGILTSLLQNYLLVEGETGAVNEKVNKLLAAFAFLKFSLMDAFVDSGALDVWIGRIERFTEWVNNLDDSTKSTIVSFMVWAVVIGAVLMVVGQMGLALLGIVTLVEFLMGLGLVGWLKGIGTTIMGGGLLGFFNLFLALYAIFVLLPKLADRFGGFANFGKAALAGLLKGAVLLGSFLVNGIVAVLETLLAIGARIASVIPGGNKISRALTDATESVAEWRERRQGDVSSAILGIDERMGMGEIRSGMTQQNNITINGNADQGVIDNLLTELERRMGLYSGSPQQ